MGATVCAGRHEPAVRHSPQTVRVQGHQRGRRTGRLELDAIDFSPTKRTGAHDTNGVVVLAPVAEEHQWMPESSLPEQLSCQLRGRRAAHSRRPAIFVQYRPNPHRSVQVKVHSEPVVSGDGRCEPSRHGRLREANAAGRAHGGDGGRRRMRRRFMISATVGRVDATGVSRITGTGAGRWTLRADT